MQAQATRMARLIDDLLSLSRIELNAHLRPNTRVELRSIVRQVVDGLQTLARDREVEISVAASADQVEVLGDRDELLRVFENLIENALEIRRLRQARRDRALRRQRRGTRRGSRCATMARASRPSICRA